MLKILVTGSDGRFGKILKKCDTRKKFIFKSKKQLNILSEKSIINNIKKYKPNYILHLAGLSRPMNIHETDISKSIDLNIVGTCNIVKAAARNNYSRSKLGGECAVSMYKNSLIIRLCMTEKPFVHKKAYVNVKSNFIFQEDAAKIILKVLKKRGILNIGGKSQTIYNFAKKYNKKIKKIFSKGEFPFRTDMNLEKLKKTLKS